ncbi:MAG: TetR/AcrR family transcriptional regulator [Spirochaetales bacterium]|nr:TetR/AcrR family transcriptional regulator [Spirochaetales bacterium]
MKNENEVMGRKSNEHIRKPEILSHAFRIIAEEGFENASLAKIAESMGVSKSMILHYFGSKENLFRELLRYMFEQQNHPEVGKDFSEYQDFNKLEKLFDYYLSQDYTNSHSDLVYYSCFYMSLKDSIMKDEIRQAYRTVDEPFSKAVQAYLDATEKKKIDGEIAVQIFNIFEEGLDLMTTIDPERYNREKLVKIIKQMFKKLLEGDEAF